MNAFQVSGERSLTAAFKLLSRIFGIVLEDRVGWSVPWGLEMQVHQLTCDRCCYDEGKYHRAKPKEDF